ncbi:malate synthase, glyoxysomal [Eurytemora carolleeae]|uniref:malate synthase, glyoxysomal n=1 Tax=Eurytemora carolleeae TaxID=1294199 RepID=UPI000C771D10|nr:malate synthase, glyoxysomal [Eurytemora carolleeae]|eukprot:XP_023347233.1 malate synthase, glyoxysomal-like [Eurytemora affinis]
MRIEVLPPPQGLENMYNKIFTDELKDFLYSLITRFSEDVNQLFLEREQRRLELRRTGTLPDFSSSSITEDKTWRISPLSERLLCRNIDLGDVSPSDTERFQSSLLQAVDGVQVDFDDGHCPTWRNQIQGWCNIYAQVNGISGGPDLETGPIMMLRPRAWNMTEHNIFVCGQVVPGPLVDFGILMFHCGQKLAAKGAGPFFYLSKLEDAKEAALWNRIFLYTQESLGLVTGTIKACVLIENILAAFQLDHILWELR